MAYLVANLGRSWPISTDLGRLVRAQLKTAALARARSSTAARGAAPLELGAREALLLGAVAQACAVCYCVYIYFIHICMRD